MHIAGLKKELNLTDTKCVTSASGHPYGQQCCHSIMLPGTWPCYRMVLSIRQVTMYYIECATMCEIKSM